MKRKKTGFCINCMKTMEGQGSCPYCGFRQNEGNFLSRYRPPGTILEERYVTGKVLGEGSFGITYIGRDILFDRIVAVKEYFPTHHVHRNVAGDEGIRVCLYEDENPEEYEQMMEKFLDEAKRLSQFREIEGIVSVHDFFFANHTAYMVMEYVEGMSLKEYVEEDGPVKGEWMLCHMDPLMDALEKIHETGLIHRDISPDNIIVKPDSSLELIDFGSARETNAEQDKSLTVVFKRGFSPAEQYRSRGEQGIWSDVYAICATMYFCLTGTVPDEALERIFVDETPSLLSMPEIELKRSQKRAIMKGISVRAQERYSSIRELRAALRAERQRYLAVKVTGIGVLTASLALMIILASGRLQGERRTWEDGTVHGDPIASGSVSRSASPTASSVSETAQGKGQPDRSATEEKTYQVPSVIGLSYKKAARELKKKKMKVTIQWVESGKDKNKVVGQSVKEGKKVKAGKAIQLKVSKGKPEVTPSPKPRVTPTPVPTPDRRKTNSSKATKKPSQDELDGMID